jgi:hypothetical protein
VERSRKDLAVSLAFALASERETTSRRVLRVATPSMSLQPAFKRRPSIITPISLGTRPTDVRTLAPLPGRVGLVEATPVAQNPQPFSDEFVAGHHRAEGR